ncbi:MAG: hypothetical protein LBE37_16425 [Sphingobacterium sp.]|nr:hypothetical protein [Sphingobacterium sp.]
MNISEVDGKGKVGLALEIYALGFTDDLQDRCKAILNNTVPKKHGQDIGLMDST